MKIASFLLVFGLIVVCPALHGESKLTGCSFGSGPDTHAETDNPQRRRNHSELKFRSGLIVAAEMLPDSTVQLDYYPIEDFDDYINQVRFDKRWPDVITGNTVQRLIIVPYEEGAANSAAAVLQSIEVDSCQVFAVVNHPAYKQYMLVKVRTSGIRFRRPYAREFLWQEDERGPGGAMSNAE